MTIAEAKHLSPDSLLEEFRTMLYLTEWNITLSILDDETYERLHGKDFAFGTNGCTEIDTEGMSADIYLKNSLTNHETYTTLLHECIHLVTNRYDSFVRDTLIHVTPKKMKIAIKDDALWEMEIVVNRFTAILFTLLTKGGDNEWVRRKADVEESN